MTEHFLTHLGWKINLEKSNRTLSQLATFLGYIIGMTTQKIILPGDKMAKIISAPEQLRTSKEEMRRAIMSLLGLMSSLIPAVQWGQLHIRALQCHL